MNIKDIRTRKGLTQAEVASALGVSSVVYSRYETGSRQPSIDILIQLADIFGVTVDYLLGRGGNKPVVTTTQKNIDQLVFKIRILSANKDKVSINLPLGIVKLLAKNGELEMLKDKKIDIDVTQLIALAEQGIVGELVNIESAGGDTVKITVE